MSMGALTIGRRSVGYAGKAYKSLGFAAVAWLAHLEMGLIRVVEGSEETAPGI